MNRPRIPAARTLGRAALALALGLGACAAPEPASEAPAVAEPAPVDDAQLLRARAAADQLGLRLMTALQAELAAGAPAAAIDVCSRIAPATAAELSVDGLRIRRTTLRTRNPANAPDPWERSWLERLAALETLPKEAHEVDPATGELRYLRPIVVGEPCLQCHGTAEALDPAVATELGELYPDDHATGYVAGELRGVFSVRVAAPPASGI